MSWELPETVIVGGQEYHINSDYRDIFQIMGYLDDTSRPEIMCWQIALGLFYEEEIPPDSFQEAAEKMAAFISEGEEPDLDPRHQLKVLDWEQDSNAIIADINRVAGQEIRSLPYLHWWTFLAYFRAIGEGQLSTLVAIRSKVFKHKPLEKWEQEYYRDHKKEIDFKKKYSQEELDEKARLLALLDG